MPAWLKIFLDTGEFLAFGLYFLLLGSLARRSGTDAERQGSLRMWVYVQFGMFILFTVMFFAIGTVGLHYKVFGVLYLLSMISAMVITIRMKQTVEAV